MTEELTLKKRGWICRTINHDKRLIFTKALAMDGMGYQLFAGATFTLNKNSGISWSNILDEFVNGLDFRGLCR